MANKINLRRIGILGWLNRLLVVLALASSSLLPQLAAQVPPRPGVVGQRATEKPHPCCYCRCGIRDYHKNCHKMCKLPPSSKGKLRVFNKIEDGFCVEVCMLKKEGKKHLNHK